MNKLTLFKYISNKGNQLNTNTNTNINNSSEKTEQPFQRPKIGLSALYNEFNLTKKAPSIKPEGHIKSSELPEYYNNKIL